MLQKFMEKLQDFHERQEKYDTHNQLFEERNSYSKNPAVIGASFTKACNQ